MRELPVAVVAIKKGPDYLMQQRGMEPKIGASGLIGFFGGKIEEETPRAAARRELEEETSLVLPDEKRLYEIGEVSVRSDYKLEPIKVSMVVFGCDLKENEVVAAREGEIVSMTKQEALANAAKLTPGTRACFEQLL